MKLVAVLIFTVGLVGLLLGLVGILKPIARLRMSARKHAAVWVAGGLAATILALVMSSGNPQEALASKSTSGRAPVDERPPAVREAAQREAAALKANWTEGRRLLISCKAQMHADKGDFADCTKGVALFSSLPPESSCRMQFDQVEQYLSERNRGNADPHLYDMAAIHYDGCMAEIESFIVDANRDLAAER